MIDFFLLGTVLYIIAMGLYELFIDDKLPMPKWLHIESLDNLKEKLVTVIIVMLAASFLGEVVEWTGGNDIFYLGAAIALLIGAWRSCSGSAALGITRTTGRHPRTGRTRRA